jgi:hypothetical protein
MGAAGSRLPTTPLDRGPLEQVDEYDVGQYAGMPAITVREGVNRHESVVQA